MDASCSFDERPAREILGIQTISYMVSYPDIWNSTADMFATRRFQQSDGLWLWSPLSAHCLHDVAVVLMEKIIHELKSNLA